MEDVTSTAYVEVVSVETEKVGMADVQPKTYLVRRSKRIPTWLWISIAHALGIKMQSNDRAVVAKILYAATVLSALVLVTTTATHVLAGAIQSHVISLKSNMTRSFALNATASSPSTYDHADVMDGVVMISLTIFWCLLGLYAKNLAYRLYNSAKFLDMVRLHAKTILKVNAAFVFFLLITTFVAVNSVQAYYTWYSDRNTCTSAGISPALCQVRFVSLCIFSMFAIIWNSLVGMVLLSVCRTNTMSIRRFIQDLEKEAIIYEHQRFGPNAPLSELMWLTENDADQSSDGENEPKMRHRYSVISSISNNNEPTLTHATSQEKITRADSVGTSTTLTVPTRRATLELLTVSPATLSCTPGKMHLRDMIAKENMQPMSTAVILQRYWRLSCAARISSTTFQRWTTCVTSLCLAWVAIGLVQWLSFTPRPLQVIQVCIPLMILPLLCAAYAEVNVEGKRLLKCICPMEQRLTALYVMWQSPPQMTVFGMTITYGSMGTAAAGLLLALASRVVLKQLGASSS